MGGAKIQRRQHKSWWVQEYFFWSLGDLKVETEVLREGEQNKRIAVHEPSAATPSSACILICNCLQPTVHCNDVKHHKILVHLSKLPNGAHLLHTAQKPTRCSSNDQREFRFSRILNNFFEISLLDLDLKSFLFYFHFSISISSHFYFTFISRKE